MISALETEISQTAFIVCFQLQLAPIQQGQQEVEGAVQGEAVQVEPMKSKLKGPGTKRSKLKCHVLLSSFAFDFNLGRYSQEVRLGQHATVRRCTLNQ